MELTNHELTVCVVVVFGALATLTAIMIYICYQVLKCNIPQRSKQHFEWEDNGHNSILCYFKRPVDKAMSKKLVNLPGVSVIGGIIFHNERMATVNVIVESEKHKLVKRMNRLLENEFKEGVNNEIQYGEGARGSQG